jgi:competence protein ComEA
MTRIGTLLATLALLGALAAPAGAAETKPVDVNTATAAELMALNGIGPAKAQAIIDHRQQNGGFKTVDDLNAVRGIGDKLMEQLRPQVTVGSTGEGKPATQQ